MINFSPGKTFGNNAQGTGAKILFDISRKARASLEDGNMPIINL